MLSTLAKSSLRRSLHMSRNTCATATSTTGAKTKPAPETKSFCMNMFLGKTVTDQIFPYPLNLDADRKETLDMIIGPTERFLAEINDPVKNDETMGIPNEVLRKFAELGAFGALVPLEYEGAGLNNSQMAKLAEIVGANDLGLGVVMGAHQSIGYKGILLYGSEEQKKKYLPDLATGRKFAAFCLTEPTSGSDANSIRSRAVLSDDGKHYTLNGSKIWISNGGFASVFTVFAQKFYFIEFLPFYTTVRLADGSTKDKVSAFIVERDFGGVTNGPQEKKMGIRGSNTTEVFFENVKIPVENLIGREGEGFKVAMNILNNGRFGIPAACTGAMKHCIQKTVDHITARVQFGKRLEEFGNVQEKLANMIARHYATESIVYMLAANMDRGISDYQLEAAIGKVFASENAWWVCDEAIQLHGGMGFMKETGLERVLRDLRIFRIFEGANDVMRLFVALTGAQHAGKHLKSGGLTGILSQKANSLFGRTIGNLSAVTDSSLSSEAALVESCISQFGSTMTDLLIKHQKEIIDRQFELSRIADAAIDIYSMIATISRCTHSIQRNAASASHEKDIAQYYVHIASRRAQDNLKLAATNSQKEFGLIEKISRAVCKNGGMPQQHPTDV